MWFQDIDFDGLNELILGGYSGGSNHKDYYSVYRYENESVSYKVDFKGIVSDSISNIMKLCYDEKAGRNIYINTESERVTAYWYYTKFYSFDGFKKNAIVSDSIIDTDVVGEVFPDEVSKWYNGAGDEITESEYVKLYNDYFKNLTEVLYTTDPIMLTDYDKLTRKEKFDRLKKSYETFKTGEKAENIEPITCYTPSDNLPSASEIIVLNRGNCGYNLTWELKSDGILTISGNGAIKDYGSNAIYSDSDYQNSLNSPWYQYNESIKKVVIESGVTSIGTYAFDKCCATDILLPDTLTVIGQHAFKNCDNVRSIRIPDSVTAIDAEAFLGCDLLTDITLSVNIEQCSCSSFNDTGWYNSQPDGVLYLGTVALDYKGSTSEVKSVTASPNGYVNINCKIYNYPDVTIRDGTTCIAAFAFSGCHGLNSIVIPDSVKYIGIGAFMNCISLESAVIGNGISKIEYGSFSNCHSLTDVYLSSNLAEITTKPTLVIFPNCEAFDFCDKGMTFHCPAGSYAESYANNRSFNTILDN